MALSDRLLLGFAGLSGIAGVALSAAAAHIAGGANLETAARFLLFHAPALIGVVALVATGHMHPTAGRAAGFALVLGLALFSGDLAMRTFRGVPLAPMAAPTGGIVLMIGWALVAAAPFLPGR